MRSLENIGHFLAWARKSIADIKQAQLLGADSYDVKFSDTVTVNSVLNGSRTAITVRFTPVQQAYPAANLIVEPYINGNYSKTTQIAIYPVIDSANSIVKTWVVNATDYYYSSDTNIQFRLTVKSFSDGSIS